jgi:hypothetical protein
MLDLSDLHRHLRAPVQQADDAPVYLVNPSPKLLDLHWPADQ